MARVRRSTGVRPPIRGERTEAEQTPQQSRFRCSSRGYRLHNGPTPFQTRTLTIQSQPDTFSSKRSPSNRQSLPDNRQLGKKKNKRKFKFQTQNDRWSKCIRAIALRGYRVSRISPIREGYDCWARGQAAAGHSGRIFRLCVNPGRISALDEP